MNMGKNRRLVIAVLLAVAGCSTIRRAHEAQDRIADQAKDEARAAQAVRVRIAGWQLADFVAFALTNRPTLTAKRLAVDDARLALKQLAADAPLASATPWTAPNLSLSGNYAESSAGTLWRDHDFRTEGNVSAGLSLSILLYDFGRYDAAAKAQAERVVAAEQSLADAGFGVFEEVSEAYFTYLGAAALLEVAVTNITEYAEHLERAQAMFDAGEAKTLDVLKAKLDYSSARESLVTASNTLFTAGVELVRTLGLEAGRVETDDIRTLAAGALATRRAAYAETFYSARAANDLAFTNAPSLRIARAQLRAAKSDVDAKVADLMPEVTASVSFSWADPLWAWSWGVGAVQSLFQGFRKTTAVDRAVVAMLSAAANVEDAEQTLSSEIATAIVNRDNARLACATAADSLAQATENLAVVRKEFEVGDATRVDYTEAVSAYVEKLGTCVKTHYAGQICEGRLFRLTGRYPEFKKDTP